MDNNSIKWFNSPKNLNRVKKSQAHIRRKIARNKYIIIKIKKLLSCKKIQKLINHCMKYETFGKDIEEPIQKFLEKKLKNIKFQFASNKNVYPDIKLPDYDISIDIKSGSTKNKDGDIFKKVTNSCNDLGTINSWINKKIHQSKKHYLIFVKYTPDDYGNNIKIDEIYFNHIYYFVGMKNNILSYREKDGNLRPKSFHEFNNSNIKDYKHFLECLHNTDKIRAKKICKKKYDYLKNILSEEELIQFLDTF